MQSDIQNSVSDFYGKQCSAENCNYICGYEFKTSKMVKLGTLLKTSETKKIEKYLAKARVQKEKPKKIKGK